GEKVFGVSDPGVAIVLGLLHRATGVAIPALGTLLTAISILTLAGTILSSARSQGSEVGAWVGGTLLLCSPYLWVCQGAGPLPALAVLLLAVRMAESRPWLAGLMAGLAFCFRPDAALGAAALGALLLAGAWRGRRTLASGGSTDSEVSTASASPARQPL